MPIGPSVLSLIAAACYCVVLVFILAAAKIGRQSGQQSWHIICWLGLAFLFAALVFLRVFDVENLLRAEFREILKIQGSYQDRREVQAVFAVTIIVIFSAAGALAVFRLSRMLSGRRSFAVFLAALSGAGMLALILLRLVSHHAIDALLYGPLKLNWVADLGLTAAVGAAALYYLRIVRARR